MKKVLQELFWPHFFWAPIPFKRYQNTSRCGTDWYKKGYAWSTYSCLHFTQFPLLDLSSRKAFFLIRATIHFAGTAIVKKKYCTCSKVFSKYATQNFCFVDNALSVSSNSRHERLYLKPSQTTKIEFIAKIGNGF